MKNKYIKALLSFVFALATPLFVSAQYYDWGQDPASIRWDELRTSNGRYVFPKSYERQASRLVNYMDTVRPYVSYGFTHGPLKKLPVVMHTQNFVSNGLVLMAPRRMELIVTPSTQSAAMPWLKQLSVHEYRHSVQYNNLNRGFVKVLSYILGQQGSMVGLALLPYWFLEGDAVLAETQMSSYGRGLQPSFTMQYRMFCEEGLEFGRASYFSGSFRMPMPDQYHVGYQIVSYADTKYGHNIWNKVAWYASRNPYFIATNYFGLRKYYDTYTGKLFRETFDDLWKYWKSIPVTANSARLVATPVDTYTTYSSPISMPDGSLVAFKEDLRRPSRIVSVDPSTGAEKALASTGNVSSPMSSAAGRVYWTEYRRSTFWDQRVNSQLCYYDVASDRKGVVRGERRATFPVAMADGGYAVVEYDYDGSYSIKHGAWSVAIADTVSVHGLAYDDITRKFYFIGLSDGGMWIGAVAQGGEPEMVTRPNFSSIANLRAEGGKLYYNSIATGKDESHVFDLASGREYAISESKYGSFSPAPTPEGFVQTTYTRDGYLLSTQKEGAVMREISWAKLPANTLNPPRRKWNTLNIDNVEVPDTTGYEAKRFRRGLNLFQVHSWAPVYFDPDKLAGETSLDIGVGVTAMSQNLLNNTFSQLGYMYNNDGHHVRGKFSYYGWAPKIDVSAEWSSRRALDYRVAGEIADYDRGGPASSYFNIETEVYLPILLSSGYVTRRLTPRVGLEHNNGRVIRAGAHAADVFVEGLSFGNGFDKLTFSLQYSENVRLAYRDFLPRWGYTLRVAGSGNPFSSVYANLVTLYGRVYLPGIASQHSLMLRATTQKMYGDGIYRFSSKELFPRGADYDRVRPKSFSAFSVDYQLPVWYPDGGITSIIYFTRVRVNAGFDMAFFKEQGVGTLWYRAEDKNSRIWSYGLDVRFDMALVGMPFTSQSTLGISIYKPSDRKGVRLGVEFSLPL